MTREQAKYFAITVIGMLLILLIMSVGAAVGNAINLVILK